MACENKCSPPPGYVLRKASNTRQKMLNQTLKPYNLTHVQFILLAYVYHHDQHSLHELTQSLIAQEAQTETMMTSSVLRTLEKKGLIQRQKSQKDARSHDIKITTAGKKLFEQAKDSAYEADKEFFQHTDSIDLLIATLQKLTD